MISLSAPVELRHFDEYRRVAKALVVAFISFARGSDDKELCSDLERSALAGPPFRPAATP